MQMWDLTNYIICNFGVGWVGVQENPKPGTKKLSILRVFIIQAYYILYIEQLFYTRTIILFPERKMSTADFI